MSIFNFAGPLIYHKYLTLPCNVEAAINNMYMNEHGPILIKCYSQKQATGQIYLIGHDLMTPEIDEGLQNK